MNRVERLVEDEARLFWESAAMMPAESCWDGAANAAGAAGAATVDASGSCVSSPVNVPETSPGRIPGAKGLLFTVRSLTIFLTDGMDVSNTPVDVAVDDDGSMDEFEIPEIPFD